MFMAPIYNNSFFSVTEIPYHHQDDKEKLYSNTKKEGNDKTATPAMAYNTLLYFVEVKQRLVYVQPKNTAIT